MGKSFCSRYNSYDHLTVTTTTNTSTSRDSFFVYLYLRGYVLGGISGTDFLVSVRGYARIKFEFDWYLILTNWVSMNMYHAWLKKLFCGSILHVFPLKINFNKCVTVNGKFHSSLR